MFVRSDSRWSDLVWLGGHSHRQPKAAAHVFYQIHLPLAAVLHFVPGVVVPTQELALQSLGLFGTLAVLHPPHHDVAFPAGVLEEPQQVAPVLPVVEEVPLPHVLREAHVDFVVLAGPGQRQAILVDAWPLREVLGQSFRLRRALKVAVPRPIEEDLPRTREGKGGRCVGREGGGEPGVQYWNDWKQKSDNEGHTVLGGFSFFDSQSSDSPIFPLK
mmetsp:Transcript_14358/g.36224  ORF Transcript_14358/g.36224 Transcript_14358/m.36224 type:complete len:216 (+) Transcript_14358:1310-1957(+)